jgi:hypothetical protein
VVEELAVAVPDEKGSPAPVRSVAPARAFAAARAMLLTATTLQGRSGAKAPLAASRLKCAAPPKWFAA